MVTPVEKRSSNKLCDFHNDKGHSTDECMQLKKQIEELVRAEKLSHLIKEIKQGRDQSKTGKKKTAVKDNPTKIYMVQSWQRTVKQKVTQSFERVGEIAFPQLAASNGTEGPLVIEAEMGGHMIHRMYIDDGSSMEILYEHCFNRLRPEIKSQMVPATTSLTAFSGKTIWPLGQLRLLATIRDASHSTKAWMNFMVVKSMSHYNGIIGRLGLKAIQAVPSTVYGMLKFPVEGGIATIRSTILIPTECASNTDSTSRKDTHRCSKRKGARARAIQVEVQKLVDARIMREVYYHDWLSNPVMVKKHVGSWRMCVDFTDLNKACPQDCYLLPKIDWKVESLCGYPFKCFLDAYKGYRQIQLAEADEEKTTFHTGHGVYCYTKMPFGLKNAGATRGIPRTAEAEQAFQQLKQHLSELPLLVAPKPREELIMYLSATYGAIRAGLILTNPEGVEFTYALRFQFTASNNEAEYEALVAGLRIATQMGVKNVQVNVGSKLVANQVLGTYVAKEDNMIKYLEIVKGLVSGFTTFSISQVPRSKNKKADALSKIASTSFAHLSKQVLVEVLENKSIKEKEVDEKEARNLRLKERQYELIEGILYKRSFLTPWLRCVGPLQADYVIREIHEGSCSMHAGPRWIHRPVARHPQQSLTLIMAPWSFYKWGIDIAGPFSEWPRKVKFFIVAMDYCTKWIEAKAVATITSGQVKKFVWDNIVCRFGIPGEIISDNGKQFSDNPFKDRCDKLNITQRFASVKHPQSNGLVERANQSMREGIKARLGDGNKNWVEELPHVLWAHRTMIKSSHGDTPFSLTYGTEVVIPTEIGMPTYRTAAVDVVNNDEELRLNLDLLEECRERVAVCEARAKSKMMKYYNARVRDVAFKPCDFVYLSNDASHAIAGGKLGPKWEGPYEVTKALGNGAYKLRSTDGTVLPRTWNVANLKRCYL
nr:reverse transcriptase domain-containing protein [Tanacetum cinerariifolium]